MAEKKPLVNSSGVVSELSGSDTIPVANYPTMVGDSGAGGTKGAVPAPSAGDAAASKFLKADGTWATAGGGSSPLSTKGDIYTRTTVDARLAVGTNGQLLVSDSGETTGLKWINPRFSFSSIIESSSRYTDNSSGGTVVNTLSAANGGLVMTTGTGTTGKIWIDWMVGEAGFNPQFSANWRLTFFTRRKTQGTDYDYLVGLYDGNSAIIAAAGITYTRKHAGIKCNRAASGAETWKATNANGTTETASTLTVSSPTTMNIFTVQATSANIRYYVNGTLGATHTTNLPALADLQGSSSIISAFLTNRAVASSTAFGLSAFQFETDI